MLEALYKAAGCEALLQRKTAALEKLEHLFRAEPQYIEKVRRDTDFDSIRDDIAALIKKLCHEVYVQAKPKYDNIVSLKKELESIGGYCGDIIPDRFLEEEDYPGILGWYAKLDELLPKLQWAISDRKEAIARAEREAREAKEKSEREKQFLEAPRKQVVKYRVYIATNYGHTVGLKADGTVVAVGNSEWDKCNVSYWRDIVAISANGLCTVGVKLDGTVVAVGQNNCGECNVSSWRDIVAIAAGSFHTVGLRADGRVVAVGENEYGKCNVSSWRDIGPVSVERLKQEKAQEKQRQQWKAQGRCQYCGGEFGGIFTKKCKNRGRKKDY
jgi:hypothetical protein